LGADSSSKESQKKGRTGRKGIRILPAKHMRASNNYRESKKVRYYGRVVMFFKSKKKKGGAENGHHVKCKGRCAKRFHKKEKRVEGDQDEEAN